MLLLNVLAEMMKIQLRKLKNENFSELKIQLFLLSNVRIF